MTVDKDGESKLSKLSTTLQAPWMARRNVMSKKDQKGVLKTAEVLVLDKLRMIPCN